MTEQSMVERVARAIALKMQLRDFGKNLPNGDFGTTVGQIEAFSAACTEAASAVIEEMREPTEAMCNSGYIQDPWATGKVWRSMIDAVLAEATPRGPASDPRSQPA